MILIFCTQNWLFIVWRKVNFLILRQSKGNPIYAKPVGIPIVPELPKKPPAEIIKMESKPPQPPPISPHKINNFVYEEDNRIILDFGSNVDERTHSPSSESSKSSSGSFRCSGNPNVVFKVSQIERKFIFSKITFLKMNRISIL